MGSEPPVDQEVRTVTAELLTREAFAPFGTVLSPEGLERLPIDVYGDRKNVFRVASIESNRPVEWLVTRSMLREFRVVYFERHLQLTQAFIPLGGDPIITVVARAEAKEEDGVPATDEVHAFIVPGNMGVQVHRGVWHEPPLPLVDGSLQLVTSHASLTAGLGAGLDERGEVLEQDVEKRNVTERTGYVLRVALP